jgi:hypothetical protein
MPKWFVPVLALTGTVVVLSALVILKSPTSSPLNLDKS